MAPEEPPAIERAPIPEPAPLLAPVDAPAAPQPAPSARPVREWAQLDGHLARIRKWGVSHDPVFANHADALRDAIDARDCEAARRAFEDLRDRAGAGVGRGAPELDELFPLEKDVGVVCAR